jgi:hypothetical protein
MVTSKVKHLCLYCGEPTKRGRKGEHIVPEAIGGALTLNDVPNRAVCPKCNSGVRALPPEALEALARQLKADSHSSEPK